MQIDVLNREHGLVDSNYFAYSVDHRDARGNVTRQEVHFQNSTSYRARNIEWTYLPDGGSVQKIYPWETVV